MLWIKDPSEKYATNSICEVALKFTIPAHAHYKWQKSEKGPWNSWFSKTLNTVILLFTILHKHKINLLVIQQLKTYF